MQTKCVYITGAYINELPEKVKEEKWGPRKEGGLKNN
jgi:hypothetical protein